MCIDKQEIEARCSTIRSLASSLAFVVIALEDVNTDAKSEGFGAAAFLSSELQHNITSLESDLFRCKGAGEQ